MKYLVSSAAALRFADGTQINLVPGIHSFEKKVTEHWAFAAHASPVDDADLAKDQKAGNQKAQIKSLQDSNKQLTEQLAEKDKLLAEREVQIQQLTEQLAALTPPPADANKMSPQETGNAKKQSSSDK